MSKPIPHNTHHIQTITADRLRFLDNGYAGATSRLGDVLKAQLLAMLEDPRKQDRVRAVIEKFTFLPIPPDASVEQVRDILSGTYSFADLMAASLDNDMLAEIERGVQVLRGGLKGGRREMTTALYQVEEVAKFVDGDAIRDSVDVQEQRFQRNLKKLGVSPREVGGSPLRSHVSNIAAAMEEQFGGNDAPRPSSGR